MPASARGRRRTRRTRRGRASACRPWMAITPTTADVTMPVASTLVRQMSGDTCLNSSSPAPNVIGVASRNENCAARTRSRPDGPPGRDRDARARHAGHERERLRQADEDRGAPARRALLPAASARRDPPTTAGSRTPNSVIAWSGSQRSWVSAASLRRSPAMAAGTLPIASLSPRVPRGGARRPVARHRVAHELPPHVAEREQQSGQRPDVERDVERDALVVPAQERRHDEQVRAARHGRNSVSPCTTPSTAACRGVMARAR